MTAVRKLVQSSNPLPVPVEVFSQHIVALGKTRSGKSSKLRVFVEYLLAQAEAPVCIIDPKGDWWGLKSSADGKRSGFPLVIFGGEHADVPINEHAGAHVAELVATGNRSCLIDLGGWMVGARTKFFIDYASTLFKLTKGKRYQVIDECHNFAPKGRIFDPDAGKALHWANRLASEGQGKGLILLAASQRPQKVHNDFLTSCETLLACRVIHKADRDAIKDWIDGCADVTAGKQVLADLAQMQRSDAWVWSPEIDFGPKRITFPLFSTYDSFKPQEAADATKLTGWAEVDLEDVKQRLQVVMIEHAANDPAELKKRVKELEKQLSAGDRRTTDEVIEARRTGEEAGYTRGFNDGANHSYKRGWDEHYAAVRDALACLPHAPPTLSEKADARPENPVRIESTQVDGKVRHRVVVQLDKPSGWAAPADSSSVPMSKMLRAMLTALAQYPAGLSKKQVLLHADYSANGATAAAFAEIAKNGYMQGGKDRVCITAAGVAALGTFEPLPSGAALRRQLLNGSKLDRMEKAFLSALIDAYPNAVSKADLLQTANYSANGATAAAFAHLIGLSYVTSPAAKMLRASEDLF